MSTTRLYRLGFSLRYAGIFGAAFPLYDMISNGIVGIRIVSFLLYIAIGAIGWVMARREAKLYNFSYRGWDSGPNGSTAASMSSALVWGAAMLSFGIITSASNVVSWIGSGKVPGWFSITVYAIEATVGIIGLVRVLRDNGPSSDVNLGVEITNERQ